MKSTHEKLESYARYMGGQAAIRVPAGAQMPGKLSPHQNTYLESDIHDRLLTGAAADRVPTYRMFGGYSHAWDWLDLNPEFALPEQAVDEKAALEKEVEHRAGGRLVIIALISLAALVGLPLLFDLAAIPNVGAGALVAAMFAALSAAITVVIVAGNTLQAGVAHYYATMEDFDDERA